LLLGGVFNYNSFLIQIVFLINGFIKFKLN